MEGYELGHAKVGYYDHTTGKSNEVDAYFRFLPSKGDVIQVYTPEGGAVDGRVHSIKHVMESVRRMEPDIIIYLEDATCDN